MDFVTLRKSTRYNRPNKSKQRVMVSEYLIQILFKLTYDLWKTYLKTHYDRAEEEMSEKIDENKVIKLMDDVCQHSHLLLKLIVYKNNPAIQIAKEFNFTKFLLQQRMTSWDLCLNDLFTNKIKYINYTSKLLRNQKIKDLIKKFTKNAAKGDYNHQILDLLSNMCVQGGKAKKQTQSIILRQILGEPPPLSQFIASQDVGNL